jgi:TusA-related sulfurtransferase
MAPWAVPRIHSNRKTKMITKDQLEQMNIGQLLALLADIEECLEELDE